MSRLFYLTLALCLLISGASATTFCTGSAPSFAPGASCGNGAANCQIGYYCDATATCVAQLAAGKKCDMNYDDDCEAGTQCQGTSTNAVCVAFASLGETCQTDSTVTKAMCGPDYDCDATTNKCTGGHYGDACKTGADCTYSNNNCTHSVCGAVGLGGFCNNTLSCGPQYFRDNSISPVACSLRKTQGLCIDASDCAFGYICANYFADDTATQCIPRGSIAAGKWCGGSDDRCQSGRCSGGYCAASKLQYCTNDNDCGIDESCTCNGLSFSTGEYGTCTYNPCFPAWKSVFECFDKNCNAEQITRVQSAGYLYELSVMSGTECPFLNCQNEIDSFKACAGASQLVVSLLFTTLLAVFAFYSSKEF